MNLQFHHDDLCDVNFIQRIEIWPIDVPITDPFVVATGARMTAQNLFMRVTLRDGHPGYGEAAPFPEVGGEDRKSCLATATALGPFLIGQSPGDYETIADRLQEQAPFFPAARCGLKRPCSTSMLGRSASLSGNSGDRPMSGIEKPTSPFPSAIWIRPWNSLATGMCRDFASSR